MMSDSIEEQVYRMLMAQEEGSVPEPPEPLHDKNGKIIYCHFCANHPTYKRGVPAITYTQDSPRVPRCGPCGRWVE